MIKKRCANLNHSKMNVQVRHCSMCGEFVNKRVSARVCTDEEHARRTKERSLFCTGCGKSLFKL